MLHPISAVGARQGFPDVSGPQGGSRVPRGQQVHRAPWGEWPRPVLSALSLRGKSCRTITFEQFKEALEELSKKRFKDKSSEEAVREVHKLIEGKAPIISGVTVSMAGRDSPGKCGSWGLGSVGRRPLRLMGAPHSLLLQKAISSPTVSRLTDTTKFTGSHKERFDPSGKGKGKAGRVDLVDESGYVPGYKHAGTYDQKVQGGK